MNPHELIFDGPRIEGAMRAIRPGFAGFGLTRDGADPIAVVQSYLTVRQLAYGDVFDFGGLDGFEEDGPIRALRQVRMIALAVNPTPGLYRAYQAGLEGAYDGYFGDFGSVLSTVKKGTKKLTSAAKSTAKSVSKAASKAADAVGDALKSIDPTTEAGAKRLANLFPPPMSHMIAGFPKLHKCVKGKKGSEKAMCFLTWLLDAIMDTLKDPAVQLVLAIMTGNVLGAILIGGKMAVERIMALLKSSPALQSALRIGKQDMENIELILRSLANSPDFLMFVWTVGVSEALVRPTTYYVMGGTLQMGAKPGSSVFGIGETIAVNATVIALLMAGKPGEAWRELTAKIRAANEAIAAAVEKGDSTAKHMSAISSIGRIIEGIGALIAAVGDLLKKLPVIGKIGNGIVALGESMKKAGRDMIKTVGGASLVSGKSAAEMQAAMWEGKAKDALAKQQAAEMALTACRRGGPTTPSTPAARAATPATSTTPSSQGVAPPVTVVVPQPLATPATPVAASATPGTPSAAAGRGGATPAFVGAGAVIGFVILGPIGAAGGALIASKIGGRS